MTADLPLWWGRTSPWINRYAPSLSEISGFIATTLERVTRPLAGLTSSGPR